MLGKEFNHILEKMIEREMQRHLIAGFKKYGIEGTEERIKIVYKNVPILKEKYLKLYKKLVKKGGKRR